MEPGAAAKPTEAFLKEFALHHDRLFAYLFSLLPHRPDAEDVFQRTSLILWQKFDQWEPSTDFLAWACGVAFYEVRNFIRVASRDRLRFGEALLETLSKERTAALRQRDDRVAALQECLKKLDQGERDLLQRAYVDEESIRELEEFGEFFGAVHAGCPPMPLRRSTQSSSRLRSRLSRL